MLSDQVLERVNAVLTKRIDYVNHYIITEIGKKIKKIKKLGSSDARKLENILKYGGSYEKIARELARVTFINKNDIYKIFEQAAKADQKFAEQFYKYKDVDFIEYDKNELLKREVAAYAKRTADQYENLSKTIGYTTIENGKRQFTELSKVYQSTIDKAIIAVEHGLDSYDNEMRSVIKQLVASGLRTVNYDKKKVRVDSAVRMNILGGLRSMSNELQKQFGEQYGADGVEISVHQFSADDHEDCQGKQFSNEQFDKLQKEGKAITYDNKKIDLHIKNKNGTISKTFRPISELNCYHNIFSIVLGVSEPIYSEEQLNEMKEINKQGFVYNGKHYTMYEGTQLQRKLEREIRTEKEMKLAGQASGDDKLVNDSENNIAQLTKQYNQLCKVSGLEKEQDRLRVSGYRRTKRVVDNTDNRVVDRVERVVVDNKDAIKDVFNGNTITISKEKQQQRDKIIKEQYKNKYIKAKDDYDYLKKRIKDEKIDKDGQSWVVSNYRIAEREYKKYKQLYEELSQQRSDTTIELKDFDDCKQLLSMVNVSLSDDLRPINQKGLIDNTKQLYNLISEDQLIENDILRTKVTIGSLKGSRTYGNTNGFEINLNKVKYKDYENSIVKGHERDAATNWHYDVGENSGIYTITHEFGHLLQRRYMLMYQKNRSKLIGWRDYDDMTTEAFYSIMKEKTGLSSTEVRKKYISDYGKSKKQYELFAELFAKTKLGEQDASTDAFKEVLELMKKWMK